jgi:PAS domain S-box-containing protein
MKAGSNVSQLPQSTGSRADAATAARDAFFASYSRELRLSLDGEGRLMLVNGAWESILGWQPEQLHGWYWEELVHPADHARFNGCLRRLRAGEGCERDLDLRLAMRTGGHHRTYWTFVSGPGVDSILGLGHDQIGAAKHMSAGSQLVELNEELTTRLEELEDRYAAVERFAATAAHQLAEPLVIAESSAILVAEELGPDIDPMLRGRLDAIGRGAARARLLMDALLAEARTAGLPLELHPVELGSVVESTVASLDHQVEERGASVAVGPLPCVLGEPGLLSVVLENLVSNALKYGPRSGGHIEISAERRAETWRITVSDEGMPIPAAEARRIFQPFYRAPGERRVPGVGLGLTICAQLVHRVGGSIGVESGAGPGNVFWIELRPA